MIYLCIHPQFLSAQNLNTENITSQSISDIQYATEVEFDHPSGMVFDATGNMYFAAGRRNKIYKVDKSGILTTIAGTGKDGFYGEGVPALEAHFDVPLKLCFDSLGNLYIADTYNYRIRKIDSQGIITTVAGNGNEGPLVSSGSATQVAIGNVNSIAFDPNNNLLISSYFNSVILKVDLQGNINIVAGNGIEGYSGDGGFAVEAMLNRPSDITFDQYGNLYIVDSNNNRIRKVDQLGIITTVAGNGTRRFQDDGDLAVNTSLNYPKGIYVDLENNLYIAEQNSNCIRKVDSSGIITTIAGHGSTGYIETGFTGEGSLAINAELIEPIQVTKDHDGNLYIADVGNNRICKIDTHGIITTVVGNGKIPRLLRTENNSNPSNSISVTPKHWYEHPEVLILIIIAVSIIIISAIYYYRLRSTILNSKQELSKKSLDLFKEKEARLLVEKELQFISEHERNRIGQDLHDSVIQQLTGVKMIGEELLKDYQMQSGQGNQYMQRLNEMLIKSIHQLRGLSQSLYPVELHKRGLQDALQEMADTVKDVYNFNCTFSSKGEFVIENDMVMINLFRIAQEAVNNAVKHSKSNQIEINLEEDARTWTVTVRDNGIGFDVNTLNQANSKSMGLHIMKYRANIIGAVLNITSKLQKGTVVQCSLHENQS